MKHIFIDMILLFIVFEKQTDWDTGEILKNWSLKNG